jgi:hypothetical protein
VEEISRKVWMDSESGHSAYRHIPSGDAAKVAGLSPVINRHNLHIIEALTIPAGSMYPFDCLT